MLKLALVLPTIAAALIVALFAAPKENDTKVLTATTSYVIICPVTYEMTTVRDGTKEFVPKFECEDTL